MGLAYTEFLLEFWRKNGYSPIVKGEIVPGNNGLYGDPETIFRNMSHWMCIACELAKYQRETNTKEYVCDAVNTLIREFPGSGPFVARHNPSKDKSNGLIGTAWILEALCRTYQVFSLDVVRELAISLMELYPFDYDNCLWPAIVEPDGELRGFDRTLNHQLWFSVSVAEASTLFDYPEGADRASRFMKRLGHHMRSNLHGVVYHTIGTGNHFYRTVLKRLIRPNYRREMHEKEWGYHGFNLLALCRWAGLKSVPDLDKEILQLVRRCNTDRFWEAQQKNLYGPSYNPVGIEIAVARDYAGFDLKEVCDALNRHFTELYDPVQFEFSSPTDRPTLNARLYEIAYLSEKTKAALVYTPETNLWAPTV
jgi:hypothetical protein